MTTTGTAPTGRNTGTRRRELIAVAADLFAEHGFANVTVDDIGHAVGVSGPALYHHFDGKEALLGEMLVDISDSLLTGGRAVAAEVDDERGDALERLIAFHAEFAVDQRSLITVHVRDLVHASPSDRARVRSIQNDYVEVWRRALRRRDPSIDAATALAAVHAAFGLINSTPHSGRLRRGRMLDLLIRMATSALDATVSATTRH